MKTTRHLFSICLALIGFFTVSAQKKDTNNVPIVTFDCAKADNSISATDIATCKKMILTGNGNYEKVKIITAIVSVKAGSNIKEYKLKDEKLLEELITTLSKLTTGSKINIEDILVTVPDPKTGKNTVRKLPSTTLVIK